MFKLEPCDVLLYVNEGKDIFSAISRWGAGRYGHVSMYMGKAFGDVPFLFESSGRGATLINLQSHTGRLVKVMRLKIEQWIILPVASWLYIPEVRKDALISEAIYLASADTSYYDYHAIFWYCIPRILKRKFPFLPIPPKYTRDKAVICSEAVAEVFWRAGIEVLPKDIVPLPTDLVTSPILEPVYEGRILEDIEG